MEHDHFEEVNIGKPLKKGPLPILMLIYRIYAQWQQKMFFVDTGDKDWWIGCSRALSFSYKMVPPQL